MAKPMAWSLKNTSPARCQARRGGFDVELISNLGQGAQRRVRGLCGPRGEPVGKSADLGKAQAVHTLEVWTGGLSIGGRGNRHGLSLRGGWR